MEHWLPLPVEGEIGTFEISNTGLIRRVAGKDCSGRMRKERILSQFCSQSGYLFCIVGVNRTKRSIYVHRAVAETFHGGAHIGMEVNHKDGNKKNNNANNLEWVTESKNVVHACETGLKKTMERHWWTKNSRETVLAMRRLYADGQTITSIARQFDRSVPYVHGIVNRKSWKYI